MALKYREAVIEELSRHGVRPAADTRPELVREYVNDLYLYEIRTLRARMQAGRIPKNEYAAHVLELRKRYPLLSLPLVHWIEAD
jgi:hypothetical protein